MFGRNTFFLWVKRVCSDALSDCELRPSMSRKALRNSSFWDLPGQERKNIESMVCVLKWD